MNFYVFYHYFQYPFLKDVWTTYKNFDNTVEDDNNKYAFICDSYVLKDFSESKNKYREFCKKLMRNLGHYDAKTSFFNPSHYRCNILYNWIYNTIENYEIPNELIIKCFDDYIEHISKMKGTYNCSYNSFNSIYLEPRKITILNIFDANMSIIKDALDLEYKSNDSPSQNFVCECVKLYKEIKEEHCTNLSEIDNKRDLTCQRLKSFNTSYMEYFYKNLVEKDNIPSLKNVEQEYMRKCQKNQPMSVLTSSEDDRDSESERLTKTISGNLDASRMSEAINDGVRANSLSPTVSTVLGTVAGASSLLGLLYKVTQNFI
ncbi:hypothetical protein PVMG_04532 [Plasmodium vivax Mauritania I]|uniref:Uncharacterized protein n=1 Tax=Plasmodium vivax Mauritania I TaxID=1035515 RepID=A0A0J9T4Z0_PLAVI|nr:hypothetical protein PVMG_04532 [Plasmodium vivax Mauritania I]